MVIPHQISVLARLPPVSAQLGVSRMDLKLPVARCNAGKYGILLDLTIVLGQVGWDLVGGWLMGKRAPARRNNEVRMMGEETGEDVDKG